MRKIILHFITLLITTVLWSQEDAQYTQYMYNMSVINPAYTTNNFGVVNLGALFRTQWVGVTGAPKTANLFAHTPLNENVEVGFSLVNDNIGDVVKENDLYADIAYKLNLEEYGNISFGIKAGLTFFDVNFNGFNLESGDVFSDPNFAENISQTSFNMGIGVYYNKDNYYIGLSIPKMFKAKYLNSEDGKYQRLNQGHFYLTGGYVFDINEQFRLKPSFLVKAVNGAPFALDVNANVLYDNRIEFGLGYRIKDAVMALINFEATPGLRIGYAYDHTLLNLGPFSSGSHEVLVLYNLDVLHLNKGFDKSPRFF